MLVPDVAAGPGGEVGSTPPEAEAEGPAGFDLEKGVCEQGKRVVGLSLQNKLYN